MNNMLRAASKPNSFYKKAAKSPLDLALNSAQAGQIDILFMPAMNSMMNWGSVFMRDPNPEIADLANGIEGCIHYRSNAENAQQYCNSLYKVINLANNLIAKISEKTPNDQRLPELRKASENYESGFITWKNKLNDIAQNMMR